MLWFDITSERKPITVHLCFLSPLLLKCYSYKWSEKWWGGLLRRSMAVPLVHWSGALWTPTLPSEKCCVSIITAKGHRLVELAGSAAKDWQRASSVHIVRWGEMRTRGSSTRLLTSYGDASQTPFCLDQLWRWGFPQSSLTTKRQKYFNSTRPTNVATHAHRRGKK